MHDLTLSTGVGGVVLSKDVALGQAVKAQQVLLVIDDREQVIELRKRTIVKDDRSAVEAERRRAEILKELYDQATKVFDNTGAISREELLHARSDWLTEQAKYDQLLSEKEHELAEFHGRRTGAEAAQHHGAGGRRRHPHLRRAGRVGPPRRPAGAPGRRQHLLPEDRAHAARLGQGARGLAGHHQRSTTAAPPRSRRAPTASCRPPPIRPAA